ncbi:hypothetical protein ABZ532_28045 [Streptomyces sp. NPDC019396]|uniref:hypothetical protein n=1 Tax=Streptomyces sp. NPDC019396 TaxID=3154687 RepID=UPI0034107768
MTACAIEEAVSGDSPGGGFEDGFEDDEAVREVLRLPETRFTLSADGCYAARLAGTGEARYAERWTLDGPEPYIVALPLGQPEEPDSEVAPMADGRVLIRRRIAGRQAFSLLYPTGPGTGELLLGVVDAPAMALVPPSPDGNCLYALAPGERTTAVWRVAGGAFGAVRVAEVPGRCSGGVWLDRGGRILALDRELGGVTKAVTVDLERGGEVNPLLQITEDSNDRLLLADPESGLLLIRSDAAGHDRLGWGVLGSRQPVRFPECLRLADAAVTPFAIQPGQVLSPENCTVALRIDAAAGSWLGIWRPAARRMVQLGSPDGWLPGAGTWTRQGELRLPCTTAQTPCAVTSVPMPELPDRPLAPAVPVPSTHAEPAGGAGYAGGGTGAHAVACKPVPLQQAALVGRLTPG